MKENVDLTFSNSLRCTSAVLVSILLPVKNGCRQSTSEQEPFPWCAVSEISMHCCYGTVAAWEVSAWVSGRG